MLDATLTAQLQTYLANVVQPIELVASLDDGKKSGELLDLLDEIAALSDKITVRRADDDARRPSFAIDRVGTDIGVRFAGIPMGHEFTSLVLALLQVGGHPSKATQELIDQVQGLDGDLEFETYFSLTCQNCPDVVQALNLMSVLNPRIKHVAIDGALFQAEVDERQVMAVPTVFINGELFDSGRMTPGADRRQARRRQRRARGGEDRRQGSVRRARRRRRPRRRDRGGVRRPQGHPHRASPPSASAARCSTRWASRTSSPCRTPRGRSSPPRSRQHVHEYDVDVMNLQRAHSLGIDPDDPSLVRVELVNGAALRARTLVLATGARWRQMGVPGEDEYRNKGVTYCPHCDGPLFKGKRVAVIGGGNSGIEAAIDLAGIVAHVTLIEFDGVLRADEVLQRKLRSLPNVDVIVSAQTTEVYGDGKRLTGLLLQGPGHRARSTASAIEGIFVQIGLLPNTDWLRGSVELSPRGEIVIDDRGADVDARRVRRRRLHDRALQADRDRHGRRLDRGPERVRPPDPQHRPRRGRRARLRLSESMGAARHERPTTGAPEPGTACRGRTTPDVDTDG